MTRQYGWERNNLPRKETEWTPELVDRLRGLWAEGLSAAEIGRRLGVSKSTICGKKKRLGLQDRPSPIIRDGAPKQKQGVRLPPIDPEAHARALMLMRAGWSNLKIVKEYGGSEWQLRKVREDAGIPKKDTNGPERGSQRSKPGVITAGRAWARWPAHETASEGDPACLVPRQMFAPRQMQTVFKIREPGACCWPLGDVGTREFRFCDDVAEAGRPYCGAHCREAYVPRARERAA